MDKVPGHMGWNFQKDSEFTGLFNHHLAQVIESGLWNKIFKDFTEVRSEEFWLPDAASFGFESVMLPFQTLVCLTINSMLTLLCEFLVYRLKFK